MRKIMKKIMLGLWICSIVHFVNMTYVFAAVPVYVDGNDLLSVKAVDIKQNALFVPARVLSDEIGADMDFDSSQLCIANSNGTVWLTIGSKFGKSVTEDGIVVDCELNAAPYINDNRMMIPLRFVAEQLGCNVVYEGVRVKVIVPGEEISGQIAYTMALDDCEKVTGRKHIVNNCIAMLEEMRGQEVDKPTGIFSKESWGRFIFYNRRSEPIADWQIWLRKDDESDKIYLQNVLTEQYYEADESIFDYYFADNGKHLELEIAVYMGPKGSLGD